MKPVDNDTLVVAVGFAVLSVSLALPVMNKLAEKEEVRDVANRAAAFKQELMTSDDPGAVLKKQVGKMVTGLAPDVAMADAQMSTPELATVDPKKSEPPAAELSTLAERSKFGADGKPAKRWSWDPDRGVVAEAPTR